MWFKQAAASMWSATKGLIADTRSPAKKLLDQIVEWQEEVVPTSKLSQLAALTYDLQGLQEIVTMAIDRIRVFKYDLEEARRTLNSLLSINYLIKHGATAFVDQLREYVPTFKKYQALKDLPTYEDPNDQAKLSFELDKIKSRAQHIQTLLQDKQKLLKEKELSMLVKQKLKLYEKKKMESFQGGKGAHKNQEQETRMQKLQWMMQKYVWPYIDKLDGKIEQISDKILTQVDKYVVGQIPQKFQLEDNEQDKGESPEKEQYRSLGDDKEDQLMKRLQEEGRQASVSNLLEFEQVFVEGEHQAPEKKPQQADLI